MQGLIAQWAARIAVTVIAVYAITVSGALPIAVVIVPVLVFLSALTFKDCTVSESTKANGTKTYKITVSLRKYENPKE